MNKETEIILIRHGKTQKDPARNARYWGLSPEGEQQAEELANDTYLQDIDLIITSSEDKTNLTIKPLAAKLNLAIESDALLDEVERGDAFLSEEEFLLEKKRQFQDLSYPAFQGETGLHALERFQNFMSKNKERFEGKKVALVSHGTIMNLYIGSFSSSSEEIMKRWDHTGFAQYFVIKNGLLIKDVI